MKQNKLSVTIDENHVITYTKNVLVSHSGTHAVSNSVHVPELSTNLVHSTLQLSNGDVILTITSDYFPKFTFAVGHVQNNTIIISEYLCYIAAHRICNLMQQLVKRGETEPLKLFNIPCPNYDRVCDDVKTEHKPQKAVVNNTLF